MDAEGSSLVGSSADHAAQTGPTDKDRPAAQLRVVSLLDRGIEGIHL
jgi:hypothetical protein